MLNEFQKRRLLVSCLVLLSKADLLKPEDRVQALNYIESHIHSRLGLELSAHTVSIIREDASLLDHWFAEEIAPLYGRHQQLAQQSLKRKIGALSETVEAALRLRLGRAARRIPADEDRLKEVEGKLRRAGGKIEETRALWRRLLDEPTDMASAAISQAAAEVVKQWPIVNNDKTQLRTLLNSAFHQTAAAEARGLYELLESLTKYVAGALDKAGEALKVSHTFEEDGLDHVLKEMPRLDLGTINLDLRLRFLLPLGERIGKGRVEKELRKQTGPALTTALASYGKLLEAWTVKAFEELQRRFSARADWYRAHIERQTGGREISTEEEKSIRLDLGQLTRWQAHAEATIREVVNVE